MTSSARDLRYGRRGGRWADTWTDEDEARYQAALTDQEPDEPDQPHLFPDNNDTQADGGTPTWPR